MKRRAVLCIVAGLLPLLALVTLSGCAQKPPVTEEITEEPEITESTTALRGEDIPLAERPEDVVFVEPWAGVFEDIHFEFDKYRIRPEDESVLQRIGSWLKEHDETQVLIEGHCDERGTNEYNMALGEQRSLSTRRYLIGLGVDAAKLTTISYGEERPLELGHNEYAWAQNRRSHFVISE